MLFDIKCGNQWESEAPVELHPQVSILGFDTPSATQPKGSAGASPSLLTTLINEEPNFIVSVPTVSPDSHHS